MQAYCSFGMAWYSGIHKRGEPIFHQAWAQGGLAHRSRENAIITTSAAQRRAAQGNLGSIATNYDGTNAFAATKKASLETVAWKTSEEHDKLFALEAVRRTTLGMEASDGWVHMQTASGAQMGYPKPQTIQSRL